MCGGQENGRLLLLLLNLLGAETAAGCLHAADGAG